MPALESFECNWEGSTQRSRTFVSSSIWAESRPNSVEYVQCIENVYLQMPYRVPQNLKFKNSLQRWKRHQPYNGNYEFAIWFELYKLFICAWCAHAYATLANACFCIYCIIHVFYEFDCFWWLLWFGITAAIAQHSHLKNVVICDTPNDFCAALHMFALFISTMDCVQGHIFEII